MPETVNEVVEYYRDYADGMLRGTVIAISFLLFGLSTLGWMLLGRIEDESEKR